MGNGCDPAALGTLGGDEVAQQLLGEDTAGGQVVVIGFQSIQSLLQRGGQTLELLLLLVGQVEEVKVVGAPAVLMGIDLVLDAVKTGHQDGGVAEVGVAGGIGVAQLKPAQLGLLSVGRDTDDGGAVGSGVAHGDGGLEAGDQTLERVGAGVGQSAQGVDVLQQTAHEPVGLLGQVGVAVVIGEDGLSVLQQQHVDMHAGAGLAVDRLGHEGGALAVLQGHVADDILDHHGVVGQLGHLVQLGLDLVLAGGADLGVVVVDLNAHVLHHQAHLASGLVAGVEGLGDVVVLLLGDDDALALVVAVPVGLLGVHGGADVVGGDFPAGVVEQIELELGQDQHGIGHAGLLHIVLSSPNDIPGILGQGPVLGIVDDHGVAGHGQGGHGAEGVDDGGVGVGDEDHVALLHHGVAVVTGIEADAVLHSLLGKVPGRDGDMAVGTVDVHHLEVHHLDAVVGDHGQNVLYSLTHSLCSSCLSYSLQVLDYYNRKGRYGQ